MRYCKECGARLEAAQASCPYCGAAAPARPEERVPEDALPVNARPEERVPETALPEEVPGGAGSPGGPEALIFNFQFLIFIIVALCGR